MLGHVENNDVYHLLFSIIAHSDRLANEPHGRPATYMQVTENFSHVGCPERCIS